MKLTEPLVLAVLGFSVEVFGAYPFPGTAVSWGKDRIDLFGSDWYNNAQVWHKTYDGSKKTWKTELLNLSTYAGTYPVALTRGKDRLDVFVASSGLVYQTWNGTNWLPEEDGSNDDPAYLSYDGYGVPSVTSSDSDRVDVIVKQNDGGYGRKYFNGSAWLPEELELEDLGRDGLGDYYLSSDPASVSWDKNSLDVFGVLENGTLVHKYWNGQAWKPSAKGWESLGDGFAPYAAPKVISRAEKQLDLFAWKPINPRWPVFETWYAKWDSGKRSAFDNLGGYSAVSKGSRVYSILTPSITYWDDRIDLFDTESISGSVGFHKWFADGKWHPKNVTEDGVSYADWAEHNITAGPDSAALTVSWAKNNINLFFFDREKSLRWQQWNNGAWSLKDGDSLKVEDTTRSARRVESPREQVKAYRKSASARGKSHLARPLVDQTRVEHIGL